MFDHDRHHGPSFIGAWRDFKKFRTRFPDLFRYMREANDFYYQLDPLLIWTKYFNAIWDAGYRFAYVFGAAFLLGAFTDSLQQQVAPSATLVWAAICGYALWIFIQAAFRAMVRYRLDPITNRAHDEIERRIYAHLLRMDMGRLSDPAFIELEDQIRHGRESGAGAVKAMFELRFDVVTTVLSAVGSIGVMIASDPFLIAIAFLPFAVNAVRTVVYGEMEKRIWDSLHILRRLRRQYENCLENHSLVLQSKLFRTAAHWFEQYTASVRKIFQSFMASRKFDALCDTVLGGAQSLAFLGATAYFGSKLTSGELSLSTLVVYLGTIRILSHSMDELFRMGYHLHTATRNYSYLEQFFATKPLIDESSAKSVDLTEVPTMTLNDVSFVYPRTERLVLEHCSLEIRPGERIAILGRNGAGKTTLLKLLAKVYLPTEGHVLIGDCSIESVTQDSWLGHMLYVTQNSDLPEFPIWEALTGKPRDELNMERLKRAATLSGAALFIENPHESPDGYDTQIGESWEGGRGYSSGQLQKLKLAAAFYRLLDPAVKVVMFDEPMAHCDTETRTSFYSALQQTAGKTIVVVAHDPLYLNYFERVVVIDHGRVIQDLRCPRRIAEYREEITNLLAFDDA